MNWRACCCGLTFRFCAGGWDGSREFGYARHLVCHKFSTGFLGMLTSSTWLWLSWLLSLWILEEYANLLGVLLISVQVICTPVLW